MVIVAAEGLAGAAEELTLTLIPEIPTMHLIRTIASS